MLLLAVYLIAADELRRFAGVRYYPAGLLALVLATVIGNLHLPLNVAHAVGPVGLTTMLLWMAGLYAAKLSLTGKTPLIRALLVEFGALWIFLPLFALFCLHGHIPTSYLPTLNEAGTIAFDVRQSILFVLVPLWVGDSLAYFIGKAFGKHPLAPSISPKKTWEGGIANFFGCILGACLVGLFTAPSENLLGPIVIGALAGIFGQAGDLFESWLKRKADIKDSGSLLPGHGGVLDRIDSLLFTALPTALILFAVASAG